MLLKKSPVKINSVQFFAGIFLQVGLVSGNTGLSGKCSGHSLTSWIRRVPRESLCGWLVRKKGGKEGRKEGRKEEGTHTRPLSEGRGVRGIIVEGSNHATKPHMYSIQWKYWVKRHIRLQSCCKQSL